MLILPGSNALSSFRTQGLLTRLQAIDASISAVTGRFTHFVDNSSLLSEDEAARLSSLLTYGEAYVGQTECDKNGGLFVVVPRFLRGPAKRPK